MIDYDTEPTFAARWLGVLEEDPQVAELRSLLARMANTIEAQNALLENQRVYISALEEAGWDVLPTLEMYWKGDRPIPATHVTGALRAVLEGK